MKCSCGPELGKIKKIKDIYLKEKEPFNFVKKANILNHGFTLEYDGTSYYLIYPTCYCSCVKRISKPLSKHWCYCTLGYTKTMFEFIFDSNVDVFLISSVKQGGNCCKIKIDIK